VLCVGVQLWARRLPTSLIVASYASIAIEAIAMIGYDGIGVFNLTVFEVVAFTLVFAWLIALVALTHASPVASAADARWHVARTRQRPHPIGIRDAAGRWERTTTRCTSARHHSSRASRPSPPHAMRDVQRALCRRTDGADEPPDGLVTA
jgi:hypothetical protein